MVKNEDLTGTGLLRRSEVASVIGGPIRPLRLYAPEISERALVARINRKLAADGWRLRVSRRGREESNLGRYFIVDARNNVVAYRCDIEEMGRELHVLGNGEQVAA